MTTYQLLSILGVQAFTTSIVGVLVGLISGAIQKKAAVKLADSDCQKAIKKALCDLIRITLYRLFKEAQDCEVITMEELSNWNELYDSYTALGGNSYMHDLNDIYHEFHVIK